MDVRIVALAKTVKDKALAIARDGLSVGTHEIDCSIHITGSIRVGEDGQADVCGAPINYKGAFATVCAMLVEQCRLRKQPLEDSLLDELIEMAMKQGELAAKIGNIMDEKIAAVERDCTRKIGTKKKRGSITTKLEYEFMPVPRKRQAGRRVESMIDSEKVPVTV